MADTTLIGWTDATFNPWKGCQRVSPGCDNCYAEQQVSRYYGSHLWDGERDGMAESNWSKPVAWNRKAERTGEPIKVFSGSWCDVFDNNAPEGQRERLWDTIRKTPYIQWQLLTKRAPNIAKYLPEDWGTGYPNVWLGVTCENIKHGIPRIDILRNVPAAVRFLSCEPLLEDLGSINLEGIHWVIAGGESGPGARHMDLQWARNIKSQCTDQGVAYFFKQVGGAGKDKGGHYLDGQLIQEFPAEGISQ